LLFTPKDKLLMQDASRFVWKLLGRSLLTVSMPCLWAQKSYQLTANQVSLLNDGGTAWSVATPGTVGTLRDRVPIAAG
jgi:hypothetical protein